MVPTPRRKKKRLTKKCRGIVVILYRMDPLINQEFGYFIVQYYEPASKSLSAKRPRSERVSYLSRFFRAIFPKIIKKRKSAYFLYKTSSRIIEIYTRILYKAPRLIK